MKKILSFLLCNLIALPLISCGSHSDEPISELHFGDGTPCGADNGIPISCRKDRVRDYTIDVNNMLRFTKCGKLRTWKAFDPYVEGACGGVNTGQLAVYGPYLQVKTGWVNARVHLLPNKLPVGFPFEYTSGTEMFAVEVYSATLGVLRRDVYTFAHFSSNGEKMGVNDVYEFTGVNSPLAAGKNLPKTWKVVEVSAHVPSAISDLEVRVQNLYSSMNVNLLGIEITHTED